MESEIGALPADVVRLIAQHCNWTTTCAFALSSRYWYKTLHECLLHPTITVQCPSYYYGSNLIVIHKGRMLLCATYSAEQRWIESDFKKVSDIRPFVHELELILFEAADPVPVSKKARNRTQSVEPFDHVYECLVSLTKLDGTTLRWLYNEDPRLLTLAKETADLLVQFLIKTIEDSVPDINHNDGHSITIRQSLGATMAEGTFCQIGLTLDDEGNLLWFLSKKQKRTVRRKYPIEVYHNLKRILLSDKKHLRELAEKPKLPPKTRAWMEATIVSFEAEVAVDGTVFKLEKFVSKDPSRHIHEEHSLHREKSLKLFIKELNRLHNEDTCLLSEHFFRNNRTAQLSHTEQYAQWQYAASEPKLTTRTLIANHISSITSIKLHSNKAVHKRRSNWGCYYVNLSITFYGRCTLERLGRESENTQLNLDATQGMFFELFKHAVEKDPKISSVPVASFEGVTHVSLEVSPRRIYISKDGVMYFWNWIKKNLLGPDPTSLVHKVLN